MAATTPACKAYKLVAKKTISKYIFDIFNSLALEFAVNVTRFQSHAEIMKY